MSKTITINLGNRGAIVTLQKGGNIKNKIFINKLAETTIEKIKEFFLKNSSASVYILLDTVAQNYNHKTFPAVNRFDLISIVKRKFEQEIPKEDLKGKIPIDRDRFSKKWNYMFISAPVTSPLKEWLELLEDLPNRLIGIYMIPLEMCKLARKITNSIKLTGAIKPKWLLIITQNKVSDLRQIAIKDDVLIFTRLLNLDIANTPNFSGKLKSDILRTGEYLKRFSATFRMEDLTVITITEDDLKAKLLDLEIPNVKFIKLTPFETAKKLKLDKFVNAKDKFCDILIRSSFLTSPKVLKFVNVNISKLNSLFIFKSLLSKMVLFLFLSTFFLSSYFSAYKLKKDLEKKNLVEEITQKSTELRKKKETKFGLDKENLDEMIDIGQISELIERTKKNPITFFQNFIKIQNGLAITFETTWTLNNFDFTNPIGTTSSQNESQIVLINPTGNIDDLFKKFDLFTDRLKKELNDQKISYSKLPSNIDFNKKYYQQQITINVN